MNKIEVYILLSLIALVLSCDKQGSLSSCLDCIENEPVNVKLQVTFNPYQDPMYKEPEIRVYEGNIEDSVLVSFYIPDSSPKDIYVTINKKYAVTATYYYANHTVTAVSSANPRVRYETKQCDNPCYIVYDDKVNLRMKYIPR
jgi:hypothetical protein